MSHEMPDCRECGRDSTQYRSLIDGVCNVCRGQAATQHAHDYTQWQTVSIQALCVECDWEPELPANSISRVRQAKVHADESGHAVSLRRMQERAVVPKPRT